jgi:hypothetical protein
MMRGAVVAGVLALGCGGDAGAGDETDTSGGSGSPSEGSSGGSTQGTSASTSATETSVDSTAGDSTAGEGSSSGDDGPTPTVCMGDCTFVRAGASGSGADWADALPELPESLERGRIYFIAAGTYPGYTFDDPESGSETIRVLRATASDHGTEDGWEPSYADGLAELGPIAFATAHHELDGRDALRIVGTFESTVVDIGASDVTLSRCDVDGNFQQSNGQHVDGACSGMSIVGDGVVVQGNVIHDAADDGVAIGGSSGVVFRGNTIHALHACGTDGGCGPCYNGHSDGLELYDVVDSEIVGNMIYDINSTAALFFGNWADELGMGASEYCENILVANNIMYTPETGFVVYLEDVVGVQVLSNTFWGAHQGAYGGLAVGVNVAGLDLYGNAIVSINHDHLGSTYDPMEHRGDYNLFAVSNGQWQDGPNDVVSIDAGFTAIPDADGMPVENPQAADFAPVRGSPLVGAGWAGDGAVPVPTTDYFGDPRSDPPTIGAIE